MTAKRQNWNDQHDEPHEAYQNLKNALYDAMIYAERYHRSVSTELGASLDEPEASVNLARRSGFASLAKTTLENLYKEIQ